MKSGSESTWMTNFGLATIRGRIIALVMFLLSAMLIFSLIMWQQSRQVEKAMKNLLDTRMQVSELLESIESSANTQVSEARNSLLRRDKFQKDEQGFFLQQDQIQQTLQQLDSLVNTLDDSIDLTDLTERVDGFNQDFIKADQIWKETLKKQENNKVRLYLTDPTQAYYRMASETEREGIPTSDTVVELTIEAEEAFMSGAFMNRTHANYRGEGYADYTKPEEDLVEWKFETPSDGNHLISFKYANGAKDDRPLRILLDGVILDSAFSFPVTERGAWDTWVFTETISLPLTAGIHTLQAVAIGESGANIDYIKIVAPAPIVDSSFFNNTVFLDGVLDKDASDRFLERIAGQEEEVDKMNAVADILRYTLGELKGGTGPLKQKNENLLEADMTQLRNSLRRTSIINFGVLGIVVLLAMLVTLYVLRSLKVSIQHPTQFIYQLAAGKVNDDLVEAKDELNEVVQAGNLLGHQLRKARDFAIQVGEGQLDHPFEPASEQDMLGNALLQMRAKLVTMAEEEKTRHWMNEGITKFSELVRVKYENKREFAASLVSELVKYVGANQGGLFIREQQEKDEVLMLQGCYAYERRKYLEKEVIPGEGLLGQAYLEEETTYLTEIPDKYITIRSGLGDASPSAILIVPLKSNEQLTGVLELAAFGEFTPHAIELVEKVAEIMAAHIANLEANERTQQLLKSTQEQAEELRSQEEEMRQNMEEMKAIQEQMHRNQQEEQKASVTEEAEQV